MPRLTDRQRQYVLNYAAGLVGWRAAQRAGYERMKNGTERTKEQLQVISCRLIRMPLIKQEIERLSGANKSGLIMGRVERAAVLSRLARDDRHRVGDRMKAIEILGRMSGDYIEKRQIQQSITVRSEDPRTWSREQLEAFLARSQLNVGTVESTHSLEVQELRALTPADLGCASRAVGAPAEIEDKIAGRYDTIEDVMGARLTDVQSSTSSKQPEAEAIKKRQPPPGV